MKKIRFLVTLALLGLSVSANAQTHPALGGGNGSEATPYLIYEPEQLADLATFVNAGNGETTEGKYYKLMNDIDLGVAPYNTDEGWQPIGNLDFEDASIFQGNFDGNNKVVKNLKINRPEQCYIGLFGFMSGGSIKNLGVENCNITGLRSVGGLAGWSETGSITGCHATGTVSGTVDVGGLVGSNMSPITNCYATVNVTGTGTDSAGGLAGYHHDSNITNCYATGNVTGTQAAGGLLGHLESSSIISYCYATGNVTGIDRVGGLVGFNNSSTVTNCIAANSSVIATDESSTAINRVIGNTNAGTLQNLYANSAATVKKGNGNVSQTNALNGMAGEGKEMAAFKSQDFYTTAANWNGGAWDFGKVWSISEGETFPWLKWQNMDETTGNAEMLSAAIKIFPNPTRGELTITNYESGITNVEIYDRMGRVFNHSQGSIFNTQLKIDLSHLPSGVFFLKIETERGAITHKVVKK